MASSIQNAVLHNRESLSSAVEKERFVHAEPKQRGGCRESFTCTKAYFETSQTLLEEPSAPFRFLTTDHPRVVLSWYRSLATEHCHPLATTANMDISQQGILNLIRAGHAADKEAKKKVEQTFAASMQQKPEGPGDQHRDSAGSLDVDMELVSVTKESFVMRTLTRHQQTPQSAGHDELSMSHPALQSFQPPRRSNMLAQTLIIRAIEQYCTSSDYFAAREALSLGCYLVGKKKFRRAFTTAGLGHIPAQEKGSKSTNLDALATMVEVWELVTWTGNVYRVEFVKSVIEDIHGEEVLAAEEKKWVDGVKITQ